MDGRPNGGRWGFIDHTGKYAISPSLLDVRDFSDGLAAAQAAGPADKSGRARAGKWGYLDRTGNWAIKPTYDRTESFAHGLAVVQIGGKVLHINRSGAPVSLTP